MRAVSRLPDWFRQEIPGDTGFVRERLKIFKSRGLNTVCLSARCPNLSSCFRSHCVTFMILGDICSRNCSFCAVSKGRPNMPDLSEAYNLALIVRESRLRYAVITSVTRDDLALGGAVGFARTTYLLKKFNPQTKVELLIPDFRCSDAALRLVVKSSPDIIGHNLETVERLYSQVRSKGDYRRSLSVLSGVRFLGFRGYIKSGLMLGLGETAQETIGAMRDLRHAGCDILTLGQYLAPSDRHFPVKDFIPVERFDGYRNKALALGFKAVYAGPLVRSSYNAEEVFRMALSN